MRQHPAAAKGQRALLQPYFIRKTPTQEALETRTIIRTFVTRSTPECPNEYQNAKCSLDTPTPKLLLGSEAVIRRRAERNRRKCRFDQAGYLPKIELYSEERRDERKRRMNAMIWAAAIAAVVLGAPTAMAQSESLGPYRYRIGSNADFVAWELSLVASDHGVSTTACGLRITAGMLASERRCFTDGPVSPEIRGDAIVWNAAGDLYLLDIQTGLLTLALRGGQKIVGIQQAPVDFDQTPIVQLAD